MTNLKTCLAFVLAGLLGLYPATVFSQDMKAGSPVAPDNTEINKRDRSNDELTADQASQKKNDVEIMQNIRKGIMADDSLSITAKNIKVISIDGKVTLKGPVNSTEEKQKIHAKAADVAGINNVINKLSVKGEKAGAVGTMGEKDAQ